MSDNYGLSEPWRGPLMMVDMTGALAADVIPARDYYRENYFQTQED